MFHLKSLVSYYRDLLFCLYYCLKLRNRDICSVNGKKSTLRFVFLQKVELATAFIPQTTDEEQIAVTPTTLVTRPRTQANITWKIKADLLFPWPSVTSVFLHEQQTDLIHIENQEDNARNHKLPDLILFRMPTSIGNMGQRASLNLSVFQIPVFKRLLKMPVNKCYVIWVKTP